MKQNEQDWFAPLWRRVAVTGVIGVWSAYEWGVNHDVFCGSLTLAAFAYALYNYFYAYPRRPQQQGSTLPPPDQPSDNT